MTYVIVYFYVSSAGLQQEMSQNQNEGAQLSELEPQHQNNLLSLVFLRANVLFWNFVKKNLSISSPLGEIFRARLRMFPALVNCCTIDWFSPWPADALKSVALKFLQDIPELDTTDEVMDGLVTLCQVIHQSVATYSTKYLAEMSRHNYVTPTSYLELLGIFSKLVGMKKIELNTSRNRLKTGLEKVNIN